MYTHNFKTKYLSKKSFKTKYTFLGSKLSIQFDERKKEMVLDLNKYKKEKNKRTKKNKQEGSKENKMRKDKALQLCFSQMSETFLSQIL